MTRDEKRQALQMWIGSQGVATATRDTPDLNEALYAISELGLWPDDVDSVSEAQAFTCWQLIERLRVERLPDNLKM
jgi:hypothetical protein